MKREHILSKKIEKILQDKQNHNMFTKLRTMKPLINIQCPESFLFYKKQFHSFKTQPNISK